jgi:peptidoglycan/LPS O-acetylase OafA/YrhL
MKTEVSGARIPQIELLRAIAVTAIFSFHLWSVVPQIGEAGHVGAVLARICSFGYLGVVVFNLVTGYVLALPHLGSQKRPAPSYGTFLGRRFLRIVPHYYLALALWSAVILLGSSPGTETTLPFSFLAHVFFVHSLLPSTFFSIVPAYWWLGCLAQFYLVFPLLVRLFQKIGPAKACLLIVATVWPTWLLLSHIAASRPGSLWALIHYMIFFNMPPRLPEFALGMWLAESWRAGSPNSSDGLPGRTSFPLSAPCALFGLVSLVFVLLGGTVLPVYGSESPLHHVYLTTCCLLAVLFVLFWPFSARIGTHSAVATVATASYSIYLLHQPVLGYGAGWLQGRLSPAETFGLLLVVGGAVSILLSRALDRLVEAINGRWTLKGTR